MSVRFGGSVVLPQPIEDVFHFVTEAEQETDWRRPYVLSSRKLTEGPVGVGSRFETVNRFWGKKETVVTEITAQEPPTLLSWKQVNEGTLVTDGSYRLEPANGGTRFTLELVGEGRGLFKPFEKMFARYQDKRVVPRFLRQLSEALGIRD
jgi:uncharacterized protein YndB with AHSA1/START domain